VVAVAVLLIAMVICLFAMVLSLTFDCWWTLGDLLHFNATFNAQERELLAAKHSTNSNSHRSSTHSTIVSANANSCVVGINGSSNYGYQPMHQATTLDRYGMGELDEDEEMGCCDGGTLLLPSERDGEMPPEEELYAPDWGEGDRPESPPSTWVLRLQQNGRVGNVRAESCDLMDVEDMI